jgi:hypothetical protein
VKQKRSALTMILVWIVLTVGIVGGWVANIVKLFDSGLEPLTGEVVVRIIGVFIAPIGVVMGYL